MKTGGPAFPATDSKIIGKGEDAAIVLGQFGMSLRDYFAAHAPTEYLAVMAAKIQETGDLDTEVATIMAAAAFMYADAMIQQRDKEQS